MKLNSKVCLRTARNVFLRDAPYFAHLCVTHRCNLRCDYCGVWKDRVGEVDLAGMHQILRIIDRMGCAMVSLTGGEPLLRDDICQIIDYAKSLNLYVRITSNGTLPIGKYEKLLQTGIDAISISLDGIRGDDLPHSKVNPRILRTLAYLAANRREQNLSVSTVLHSGNVGEIHELLEYVSAHDRVGAFVQPVVAGDGGQFRVATQQKVDPTFLKSLPTLDPDFFIDGCAEYARRQPFNWHCKAGQLFFDIKPNGDFWLCQDFPTGLNVLDPAFIERWRAFDFKQIRGKCSGCVYSCYYLTQHAFLPRNWGDMLEVWRKLN